ncbi:fasciclin domain-containing protein [Acidimangrovimonas sediminis]|uniref:fasciclin domain-containing protein n=1 Tax=Acidimangrovimonas sediminis TaxID=2056283 RepID=UPI000C7FF3F4|nr:fasciclin domain-containing protein [Acidimangrovimonas sediminis]
MTKSIRTALAIGAIALAGAGAASANPMVGGAPMYASKNIVQNAIHSKDHTTLVAAVKAAGLVKTLEGPGPFTVLAPTNEAFAKLPAGTVDTLLKPENKEKLTKILTCHVIAGKFTVDQLKEAVMKAGKGAMIKTVGGCEWPAMVKDGNLMIMDNHGDTAMITIPNVMQSNGVIDVIDTVLLP